MNLIDNSLKLLKKHYKTAALILFVFFVIAFSINNFIPKKYYIRSIITFSDQQFPIENKSGYDFNILATLKTELRGRSYVPEIVAKYNISEEDIPSFKINMVKYLGSFEISTLIEKSEFEKYSNHLNILLDVVKEKYLKRMDIFISKYKMLLANHKQSLVVYEEKIHSIDNLQILLEKRKEIIQKKIIFMNKSVEEYKSLLETLKKKRARAQSISKDLEKDFDLEDDDVVKNWLNVEVLLTYLNKKIDGCLDTETNLERLKYELHTIENDLLNQQNAKKSSLEKVSQLKNDILANQQIIDYFADDIVVKKPVLDEKPSFPKRKDNYVLAFLLGVIFVILIVFIKEYFDNGVI